MNPWKSIDLIYYEHHMKQDTVKQLQALNLIMQNQIYKYNVKVLCILGVAGGNGLEHIQPDKIDKVYGIDINCDYIRECEIRYGFLNNTLELINADLLDIENTILPEVDLIIANLLIEYIESP